MESNKPNSLPEWLAYLEQLHPQIIEMGLARINQVKLQLDLQSNFPVIVVGGTNGKGSVCVLLEAILSCAGYRVGCYTSPHLLRYNERVCVDQRPVSDTLLCQAFESVNQARLECDVSLTYFEFGTLVAMTIFHQADVDLVILEVGLGGRLDAVNIFDADCSIVTSVGLDHMDYLGDTRDQIGFEKAGIFRKNKPAICAEPDMPDTVRQQANNIDAVFSQINLDFGFTTEDGHWHYWGPHDRYHSLPYPALRGHHQLQNASACLTALGALRERLPVSMSNIREGLLEATLPGRFQVLPGQPFIVLDVAHNPDAAQSLASNLEVTQSFGRTYAVFAILKDKDIVGVVNALKNTLDIWLIAPIDTKRGASLNTILKALSIAGIKHSDGAIQAFSDVCSAYAFACDEAGKNDRICVFGSFYTVSAVLQCQSRVAS